MNQAKKTKQLRVIVQEIQKRNKGLYLTAEDIATRIPAKQAKFLGIKKRKYKSMRLTPSAARKVGMVLAHTKGVSYVRVRFNNKIIAAWGRK